MYSSFYCFKNKKNHDTNCVEFENYNEAWKFYAKNNNNFIFDEQVVNIPSFIPNFFKKNILSGI